jgi:2-oxoglutarate ferredoxin oxidoreductase subunit gamma
MKTDLLIAGFGGQGVLFAGRVLAHAALLAGLEVTWLPSYGPQMRGGTANCAVVVSDRPIRSPVVSNPTSLIALNRPSLDAFESQVQSEGLIIANSTLLGRLPSRADARVLAIAASEVAEALGDIRVANVVALGAYVALTGVVSPGSVEAALATVLPPERTDLLRLNEAGFREGMARGTLEG